MKFSKVVFFVLALCPAFSALAQTTYTDRGTWTAAVSGSTVVGEDFNSVASDVIFTNSGTTVGSLQLTSTGGAAGDMLLDALPGSYGSDPGFDGTSFLNAGGLLTTSVLTITFPQPVQAFGFDTMNYDGGGEQAEIFVNGQSVGLTPVCGSGNCAGTPNQTFGFVGLVAAPGTSFTTIEIRGAAATTDVAAAFDNLDYVVFTAEAETVPTLGTIGIALLALMLLGVGMYTRRQSA